MRYIDINDVLQNIPSEVITALNEKHQVLLNGPDNIKSTTIDAGNATWSKVKITFGNASSRKCWYTESLNSGCIADVDHFRPKGKKLDSAGNIQHWYWFLAFDPENYRLSCQIANRPNKNPLLGDTGGKHQHFPLLNNQVHAIDKAGIARETPLLLDPCIEADCNLLQFLPDGRPVVANAFQADPIARLRVEKSNLLLNLDYATFNEDREKLYNKIKKCVQRGDSYGPCQPRLDIQDDLRELMDKDSAYSKAAECYIRCFRDREWVDELFY